MKSTNFEINFPLGIYEKAINDKFEWEDKILIAKSAGFNFIEISIDESDARSKRLNWSDEQINDLKLLLIKHDFYINSMCLSVHRKFPFGSADEKIRNEAKEILIKALNLARKLGIRIIQLAAYDVYYEKSTDLTKKYFLENIKWAAKEAQKYSVMLAFETMDTEFVPSIEEAMKYVNEINSPFLQIYPDIGNLTQWVKDFEKDFESGKNHVVAFHFKDTKNKVFRSIEWGKGDANFPMLLNEIKKINFNGPFLIEMWSKNEKNESFESAVETIKTAKKFYYEQWEKALKNDF